MIISAQKGKETPLRHGGRKCWGRMCLTKPPWFSCSCRKRKHSHVALERFNWFHCSRSFRKQQPVLPNAKSLWSWSLACPTLYLHLKKKWRNVLRMKSLTRNQVMYEMPVFGTSAQLPSHFSWPRCSVHLGHHNCCQDLVLVTGG